MNSPVFSSDMTRGDDRRVSASFCLANARLILDERVVTGKLCVEDGVIAEVRSGGDVPAGAIDCGGDYVLPGLVELHTDNLERHIQPRPGVDWPHVSALLAHDGELASCGITTVFDALRVGNTDGDHDLVTDDMVVLDDAHRLRVEVDPESGEPTPLVPVRGNLQAIILRSVFYDLVDIAEEREVDGVTVQGVTSEGVFHIIGRLDGTPHLDQPTGGKDA